MARKLLEKAGLVQVPPASGRSSDGGVDGPEKPKTAPGSMLHFMTSQSSAIKEAEVLRDQLAVFDGASPVRLLDAARIRVSAWSNRHPDSFKGPEFGALKEEIAAAGGNVQPIKVRPLAGPERGVGPSNPPPSTFDYEVVFGHRRHRACLDLGLPVLALIEAVSEQDLFIAMERENRGRKDLSAWEQGMMYARALDQGLYSSNRQLATAIGRDLGDLGKALALARLPVTVVEAFASPLDLQYRWAKPLSDAQQKDPELLLARAKAIKDRAAPLSPRQVFDALLGKDVQSLEASVPEPMRVTHGRKTFATLSSDPKGRTLVTFDRPLSDDERKALVKALEDFGAKL
jgi:ParB family chromosome partitioning protein